MLFQFISLILIAFIIGRIVWQYKQRAIQGNEFIFWSFFWVLAAAAILIPDALTRIANALGIGRGTDFAFYASFVIVGYVLFRIVVRIDKIERDVTKIVRHLALEGQDQKSKLKSQDIDTKV